MNLELNLLALGGVGVGVAVMAGGLLGLHLRNRVAGLGYVDGLRATVFVTQYAAALEYYSLGRAELRARVDELRANLAESAAAEGLPAALDRLGPPRALAAEVAGSRLAPSWLRGVVWLAVALLVLMLLHMLAMAAFVGGFESVAAPGESASWGGPFWTTFEASADQEGVVSEFGVSSVVVTPVLVLAFLWGSRVWRVWTRGTRAVGATR